MYHLDFRPRGVCSYAIHVDLDDTGTTIEKISFDGGCNGNLKAISKLVAGHPVDEIVELLAGNDCAGRGTSCADQLTIALTNAQTAARAKAKA